MLLCVVPAGIGCQSTVEQQTSAKPAGLLSHTELVQAARLDLDRCIHAFYADRWDGVGVHAARLAELGIQWNAAPAAKGRSAAYRQAAQSFAAAAEALRIAGAGKDVGKTTLALRKLSESLSILAKGS